MNQKTGDVVSQYAQSADRVVNLTQTSIVRINASPESVNYYQREGNDLIVHMNDGTTVRYQRFFVLDENGLHSELIFEDDLGAHHAVFPFAEAAAPATAEAIVPALSEASVDSLVGAGGLSALAVLGGVAAIGGIVGIAAAAGGGGGGSNRQEAEDNGVLPPIDGTPPDNGGTTPPDGGGTTPPDNGGTTPPDDGGTTPPDDGGTTPPDDGGTTPPDDGGTTPPDDGGTTPPDDGGTTPPDGGGTTPPDGGGTTPPDGGGTTPPDDGGETTPPVSTLSVAPLTGDNMLNLQEVSATQVLSGSTEADNAGSPIVVTVDQYTWTTQVNSDGTWNIDMPANILQSLQQGLRVLRVVLTDSEGRTVTTSMDLWVDTIPPVLQMTPFVPNNTLDVSQLNTDKIVRGFSSSEDQGSVVTVTLNGKSYTTAVDSLGRWQLSIPQADIQQLQDGQPYTVEYQIVDMAGNVTTGQADFTTNFTSPQVSVNPVTGDNVLNTAELQLNQTLSGQTVNIPAGQVVTITLGTKTYYAQVMGDGSWKTTLPAGDLASLTQGDNPLTVSVNDANGTPVVRTETINVDGSQNGIAIAILSTDDYLNANEAQSPLEVRGVTTVTGPDVSIVVFFNGKEYAVTAIDAAGNWSVQIPSADLLLLPDGPNTVEAVVTQGAQSAGDTHTLNVQIHYLPIPTIDAPFGDGYLNSVEKGLDQVLSGNTGVSGSGQSVSVQLAGKTYQALVDGDGNWRAIVPASDMQTIPDGLLTINVNAIDAAGNSAPLTSTAQVDTTLPALSLLPLTADGKLNGQELGQDQILSGISSVAERGQPVTVVLNGKTYTATVGTDGNWQLPLPAADLQQLSQGSYPLTVTLTDTAGNTQTVTQNIDVKTALPALTVQALTDGNDLDAAEIKVDQILHGTVTNAEPGSVIIVNLGSGSYQGTVDAGGNWRVTLPAVELQKLADGTNTLTVSVTDGYGQNTSVEHSFTVDTTVDAVAISIISSDDYLNFDEASSDLVINGNSAGLPLGTVVNVTLNGQNYVGAIAANGAWQVTIGSADLLALNDGSAVVTATATGPNGVVIDSHTFTVIVNDLPRAVVNTPFGDGVVNLTESGRDQFVTGNTGVTGAGQTVVATLNGQQYTGTVAADGSWSVVLPAGAMTTLPDGPASFDVTVTDAAGNDASQTIPFTVDKVPPELTVQPINGTDTLNATQVQSNQAINVISPDAAQVTVNINGTGYTALPGATPGSWVVTLPAGALAALPDGQVAYTVTVTDAAGNATTVTRGVSLDATPPNVVVDPVTRDNVLDPAELANGFTLTGRTVPADPGATVALTVNGQPLSGVVNADGSWAVQVPATALAGLGDGPQQVTVTVTDSAGNASAPLNVGFAVDSTASALLINPVEGDNAISLADISDGITISGSSVRIPEGTPVTVTLNGQQYQGVVNAGGFWTVNVPTAAAALISDGTAIVTVSSVDVNGVPLSSEQQFLIITQQLPLATINTPFGDGTINIVEAAAGGALTGTTGSRGPGQTVTVQLDNNAPITGTVDANGNWTLPLTPAQIIGLGQGSHTVTVTVADAAGNQNTQTAPLNVDTVAPQLTINAVTADNTINGSEASGAIVISGTGGPYDPQNVQAVIVLVNGQNYDAILQQDGTWSIILPAGALANVADGPVAISARITDPAGNTTTIPGSFTLDASPLNAPLISVNTVAADNFVNALEAQSPLTISGTTTRVEAGQTVTVTLSGQTYTAQVNGDGRWTLDVPATALTAVADGTQTISVQVSDLAGNVATGAQNVTFAATPASQPTLTVNVVAQDDIVNIQEQGRDLIISGSSTNLAAGTVISATFAGAPYSATVGSNGSWQFIVPQTVVQTLTDGTTYTVTATAVDAAQNSAQATHNVGVDLTRPLLSVQTAGTFLEDNRVNIAESLLDQTITGTGTPGLTVLLPINGKTISAVIDGNGGWSMTIPAADLQSLPQGTSQLGFSVTDPQGNSQSVPVSINVNTQNAPAITLNPVFGDNIASSAELAAGTTLTGTVSGLPTGTQVTVTIGTQSFLGTVTGTTWAVTVPGEAILVQANSILPITVTALDAFGNPATATATLDAVRFGPVAELPPALFGDGYLNQVEANTGAQITGSTGQAGPNQQVRIVIDGLQEFVGTVDVNGNWTVPLTPQQLNAFTDATHSMTVTITDRAGNVSTSPAQNFTVLTDALTPPTLATAFTDGFLSAAETLTDSALTGSTGVPAGQVGSVLVSINSGPAIAATVTGGTWTLPLTAAQLQALPDGVLSVNITVTDIAGNQISGQGSFEAIVNALPQAQFVTPFGDGTLNFTESQSNQVLQGNTGVTGPGQTVRVALSTGQIYTGTVQENGDWTITLPAADLQTLANNTTPTFEVTVTDRAGNTDTDPGSFQVRTALPAPIANNLFGDNILNINEAAGAAQITGSTQVLGPNQFVTIRVNVNGTPYTANVLEDGTWTINLPAGTLQSLAQGPQQLVIYAEDQYGNSATVPVPYQVALTPPNVTITTPLFGDNVVSVDEASGTNTIAGSFTSPYPVGSRVDVTVGGKLFTNVPVNGTTWSLTLTDADWAGVARGDQSVQVTVTDGAGNANSTSAPVTILIDVPTLQVTTPFAGDNVLTYDESQTVQTIAGTSTNLEAGQPLLVTFPDGRSFTTTIQANGSWTLQLTPADMAGLTAGTITVQATDRAGNLVSIDGGTLSVDLTPPPAFLTLDVIAGDDFVNASEFPNDTLPIAGRAVNVTGLVNILLDGQFIGNATIAPDGSWTFNVPRASLVDGPHTLSVESVTTPGFTASQPFVVDTAVPTITLNNFAGDNFVNVDEKSLSQTISGTASEPGRDVQVTLNGKTYYATVNPQGEWTVTVPQSDVAGLTDGTYPLTASITDAAGNPQSTTQTVTVDASAPLLSVDTLGVPAVLNTTSAATGLLLQGTGDPGNEVTIQLGPISWTGQVDAQGNWRYDFPNIDLTTLADGPQVISISSRDSAGNVSTNNVALNVALNPTLGLLFDSLFFGDGILNVAESLVTQTLTGRVEGDYRGARVNLTLVGTDVTINDLLVGPDGRFSVNLPPEVLQGLVTNTLALQFDVIDANGNTRQEIVNVGLALTDLPVVGEILLTADNVLNSVESGVAQTLTGTLNNAANVTGMVVNFGGQAINAVVDTVTGAWSAVLPDSLLNTLPDGQANVGLAITDAFGNVINTSASFNVARALPTIGLDPLFSDGVLSIPELLGAALSGTSTRLAGQQLTIQIGNAEAFTTNVDGSGRWAVNLPAAVQALLQGIGTGDVPVTISAFDQYGNPASQTANIRVDLVAPVLNSLAVFTDNVLNVADSLLSQTISGVVGNAPVGSRIEVQVAGKTFLGSVGAGGVFSIGLAPSDLTGLLDGAFQPQVTIVTPDGNSAQIAAPVEVRVGLANLPTVVINSLFGNDGYINLADLGVAQTISGTAAGLASGLVTVNVAGQPFTGNVVDGVWSVTVPAGALAGSVVNGALSVTASVVDTVGNVVTGNQVVNAIVQNLPTLGLNTLFGNGTLDLGDLLSTPLLSGTSTNLAAGTIIDVKIGPLSLTTTVGANGTWQLPVPTVSLQGLADGVLQVTATARDVAGNVANTAQDLTVAIQQAPSLLINTLFGGNGLNAAEILSAQVVSGTSTNAAGSLVNVSLGGKTYQSTVAANGNWSVSVPKTDLAALLDGTLTVNASLVNPAGKNATATSLVDVITHNLPTISLTSLFGNDGYLNINEAASGQVIGGKIGGVPAGASVVVTLGGTPINALVDAAGNWTATVSNSVLQNLATGALKVGVAVTDRVGNTTATEADVGVKLTQPTLAITPVTNLLGVIGGVLTGLLGSAKLTISGTSNNLGQGALVHLNLLNLAQATAITGADGRWSTTLDVGLDLARILSLGTVINLYAADVAGNVGYLNVGLNGSNPTTTPPVGVQTLAADATSFSLLAASAVESSDTTQQNTEENSATHAAVSRVAATHSEVNSEESSADASAQSATADDAFTIGGLSITLADGTQQSGESVQGSDGSDTIHLSTLGFIDINGGAGTDTLVLDGVNMILNLIDTASRVHNVEIIDLGKSGTNSLTLDLNEALTVTDKPEDDLVIKGSNGDQVNLVHGANDIWAISGQREVDGMQFDVYHNSAQNTTLGDVLVQQGLHVNMV
ncbi:Ig-like domain-containing protein [Enterobacter sp. C2]|uniref:Ig-like domain-containing protein n=1 Tax=Enterobacter sp. C2 TaxID=2870346 RepID=UPI00256FB9CB|nr:Ig-like domain-containing protein [Enterobacter sp. C2]